MVKLEFLIAACLGFMMCGQSSGSKIGCEKKEVSLVSLEIAENFVKKAKGLFPNCTDIVTSTSECGAKEKAAAYLDMAIKLISEAKEKYPTCITPETEDPETEEPATENVTLTEFFTVTEDPVTTEYPKTRDCSELLQNGQNVSGVYTIRPSSSLLLNRSLEVFCDMDTDGGGWTVIQRRGNFRPQEEFNRNWNDYKFGFGNITKDFWLGNDNLFILSDQRKYKIRFDLENVEGEKAYALYDTFYIENEESLYKLHIGNFSGNAGDSMERLNHQSFSTKDRDNMYNCVSKNTGGWWYENCGFSQLNSQYNPGVEGYTYVSWYLWKKKWVGLVATEIKIKSIVN